MAQSGDWFAAMVKIGKDYASKACRSLAAQASPRDVDYLGAR